MSKALSMDLRVRVLAAVSQGLSHRAAAERFEVSAASISRGESVSANKATPGLAPWVETNAQPGSMPIGTPSSKPWGQTGMRRSKRSGIALPNKVCSSASARSSGSSHATTSRVKKSAHASEQDRPDILKRRQQWFDGQLDLDPARLVFIDETWASTNMVRRHGRCTRGERLRISVPHGHWKTTTFIGALTLRGFIAPFVIDRPINRISFETYVEMVLLPALQPGDIVVMDNLSSHKGPGVRAMIESIGARLEYLPPYSPDFNPIENAFSKLKALLRKAAERSIDGLWNSIGRMLKLVTPNECQNYFKAAGYDAI